ncbi:MAG: 50S ribosomal protein L35 [Enterobacteriaceae bacterium]|nr:50S ribosomal protein L35 [Enterobacteriaceae bacterium]
MPKLKNKKGTSKRFKKTGSGVFKHKQSHLRHILTKKSSKRKRHLRTLKVVDHSNKKALTRALPNF